MRRKEKRKRKFNAVVNLTVTMPTTGKVVELIPLKQYFFIKFIHSK
jgi:hypothetical protein